MRTRGRGPETAFAERILGKRKARGFDEGGDALRGLGLDGAGEDGRVERDDGNGRGQVKVLEPAEAAVVRIGADEDGAKVETAAESFEEQVLALEGDDFGHLAAALGESCPQFTDPRVLATLYNADEARAIRNRRHGGILNLRLALIDQARFRLRSGCAAMLQRESP